ncbi:MAG: sugar phosphate isomerase/epimerase [Thermodesulfovibrionales bacterium]|nr:sugar phosphate isomerase/epimerase [Thermodesulfovibrionales bacterium]
MIAPQVHVPYHRIREYLPFIKKNRINLEVYFSAHILDALSYSEIKSLRSELDYNPSLTIHAPFMDLSPGAVDDKIREITLKRFSDVFDIAALLKPKVIVFHSGYEKWKYALKVDLWLEKSILTWKELVKRAVDMETKIAIENVFEDNPENLRLLMEAIASEHFGVCFDTGHFNLFSKLSLKEWLRQIKRYLIELHLHDNSGQADDHLAIGEGNFDFPALFAELNNNRPVYTIESHSKEGVLKSIEKLNTIYFPPAS